MDINAIIAAGGGPSKLGAALGLKHSSVCDWRLGGKVPARHVPKLSELTGIPRHRLRPDLWEPPPTDHELGAVVMPQAAQAGAA